MTGVLADERMSDLDTLVWNVESRARNRTTIAALATFAGPLDAERLRCRVDRATRVIPRLRQRVIDAPAGVVRPRWSVDPDFDLGRHLHTTSIDTSDASTLVDRVRDLVVRPFDRTRPLWEITHLTGMPGGDALLLKSHHSVSDGVGGVEMVLELFDLDAEPGEPEATPLPEPRPAAGLVGAHSALEQLATRSLADVAAASRELGRAVGSATRMLRPSGAASAVPTTRSDHVDLRFVSVALDDLRRGGRRVGGSINDAFVGAVALGIAAHFDATAGPLRVAVPISTRGDAAAVGNHWTPGRIDLDLGRAADSNAVLCEVRQAMRSLRRAPAHQLLAPLAAGLCRLPAAATSTLFSAFGSTLDVAASNVPGSPVPLHLCGRPVEAMIPFGPLSGCAVNVTLLSHAGTAHIGISSDPAAVPDPDRLADDLRAAFARIAETTS